MNQVLNNVTARGSGSGNQQVNAEATRVSITEEGGETIVLLVICRFQMAARVGKGVNPVTFSLPS